MIPAKHSHLYVAATTNLGMKRKNNEDRYAVSAYKSSATDETPAVFAMVSDGIGGHRAGEVAAEMVVEIISQTISKSDTRDPKGTLQYAINQASLAVRAQSEANPHQEGMGATCVCVWVIGDVLYTAYVGDSRLYLIRGNSIQRLTTDHTWIQEAVEYGALTPEQARSHPNAHVIRRYLGSQKPVEPDFRLRLTPDENDEQAISNQGTHLLAGDCLLLCSDGLTDLVNEQEILSEIKDKGLKGALSALVNLANQRGGHDNITIVTLEAPPTISSDAWAIAGKTALPAKERSQPLSLIIMLIIIGVVITLLAGAGVLGWGLLAPKTTPTATSIQTSIAPETTSQVGLPVILVTDTTTLEMNSITAPRRPSSPTNTYTPWPTDTVLPSAPQGLNTPSP